MAAANVPSTSASQEPAIRPPSSRVAILRSKLRKRAQSKGVDPLSLVAEAPSSRPVSPHSLDSSFESLYGDHFSAFSEIYVRAAYLDSR